MSKALAANDNFIVSAPSIFSLTGLRILLRLAPREAMNWRIMHKPSGSVFHLTNEEHDKLDEIATNLQHLSHYSESDAADVLLHQVEEFWKTRA